MNHTSHIHHSPDHEVLSVLKVFYAAVVATGIMTLFMLGAPAIGLPAMNVGDLLGSIFRDNIIIGWFIHSIIGIIFTFVYVGFFNDYLPVINNIQRGTMYGIIVFIFSEINFMLINLAGFLNWNQKENMALMIFGNCIACIIYGAVLGTFFKRD